MAGSGRKIAVRDHLGVCTTVEMLRRTTERYPAHVAMRMFRNGRYEELTYTDFSDRVDLLAAGLMRLGIKPGAHVSMLGENRPEWGMAYLAVHRAGAVCVPLDSLQKVPEFRHNITDAEVEAVIVSERFLDDILEVREKSGLPRLVICMDKTDRQDVLVMSDVMEGELPSTWPEVKLTDLAAIIYTSGTTGQSKGVMLTQRNIMEDTACTYQVLEFGSNDTFLSVLPLHHTFECTGGFLLPLYAGASITYARSLKSRDIIDDIKNTGVTFMLGVPLLFEKMMEGIQRKLAQAPASKRVLLAGLFSAERLGRKFGLRLGYKLFKSLREKAGLATVRIFCSGGAALPPHVSIWYQSLGFPLYQGYGLTETSPVSHVNLDPDYPASVGFPISCVETRIDRPGPDGHGEICLKGPTIMAGYFKNEEATRAAIDPDGWFHTGDIGIEDADGRLYISGRQKNVIVTASGKNVYPEEVEFHINQSPWVLESLVIGKPIANTTSEEVYAMVVPNKEYFDEQAQLRGRAFTEEEIEAKVREEVEAAIANIADYKRPKRFEIRFEEFEKTSTKKIKRFLYKQHVISLS